jgi:hypothetical protein
VKCLLKQTAWCLEHALVFAPSLAHQCLSLLLRRSHCFSFFVAFLSVLVALSRYL